MTHGNRHGLYIHIPLCRSKCWYCDFCSRPPASGEMTDAIVRRIVEELDYRAHGLRPTTVYIGGGTPSLLSPSQLKAIVENIDRTRCEEFTIEANPEDVTDEWTAAVKALGIDRVSMGVQSMVDRELHDVGRRHDSARALAAYETLRRGGIENISLDLIYGLPGQTVDSWKHSLERVATLRPDHISCYHLSYEPGTRLYARRQKGIVAEASETLSEQLYSIMCRFLADRGYEHYEISNFCLPGRRAVHNSSYWDTLTPYIGIGPGAHSFDGNSRSFNRPDIVAYRDYGYKETLTADPEGPDDIFNDYVMTRLRTSDGLSLAETARRFGRKRTERLLDDASTAISLGNLATTGDDKNPTILFIPEDRWLISDSVIVDLLQ